MDSSTWTDAQALAYIASYSDLISALGANPSAGRTHFAQAGNAEGRSILFDPLRYLATYSDLRSSFGADLEAAARHYILAGAAEGRSSSFDGLRYIASYADLITAYGTNVQAATRHFVEYGAAEGRGITFDPMQYLAAYADLRAAYGVNSEAATRHYIMYGAKEGRNFAFDALSYTASYSDLSAAFGTDTERATEHYVRYGANEGREIKFDPLNYVASYSDLRLAIGTSKDAATRHMILYGWSEGRAISFDPLNYIASYSDLRAAYELDGDAAARHFILYGANEGRSVTFDPVAYLLSNPDLVQVGLGVGGAREHWIRYGAAEGRTASGAFGNEQAGGVTPLSGVTSGKIESAGDLDWFQVKLKAGNGVTFDLNMATGQGSISIRDDKGRVVPTSETVGSETTFLAQQSGTYFVIVSGTAASSVYSLGLKNFLAINGSASSDVLSGTDGPDRIRGLGGNDQLSGRGGDDVLEGGDGYDQLEGGPGNDKLFGNNTENIGPESSPEDRLFDTKGGDDQLFGQLGSDSIWVSRFSFEADASPSTLLLDGGEGADLISFESDRYIDTVNVRGGSGSDEISIGSVLKSVIEAGDGDDRVNLRADGSKHIVNLGLGSDRVSLLFSMASSSANSSIRITDFKVGADTLDLNSYLANALQGWSSATNPFATRHLKLTQSGNDAVLQIDLDGTAGGSASLVPLVTFANISAADLGTREIGYSPTGSASPGQTIVGTSGDDTLSGADGPDIIRGLDGIDELNGRGGNDVLEGGFGSDYLDGGPGDDTLYGNNEANSGFDSSYDFLSDGEGGNDKLYGQDGDDLINVSREGFGKVIPASSVLLDGGVGNDRIYFWAKERFLDTVVMRGGAGNDEFRVGSTLSLSLDAGGGGDFVRLEYTGGNQSITLGVGPDVLQISAESFTSLLDGSVIITDFQAGIDKVDLDDLLARSLVGREATANPFATGHLKLVQSGPDTLLQIDRDGDASNSYSPKTVLSFANLPITSLSLAELGDMPDGSRGSGLVIAGTIESERLIGTNLADTIKGLAGDDVLNGRAGNDLIEGGTGTDTLEGGLGDDLLYGNNVNDSGFDFSTDIISDVTGGNDHLYGQGGDDTIYVNRHNGVDSSLACAVLLDGGAGNDSITFSASRIADTVTVRGGSGDDRIYVASALSASVEAGEGADQVTVDPVSGSYVVGLGGGGDTLELTTFGSRSGTLSSIRIVDFQIGSDSLNLQPFLVGVLREWAISSNPFSFGYLKLYQSGADTIIQIDRDGSGGNEYSLETLLTLSNVSSQSLTSRELGYTPGDASYHTTEARMSMLSPAVSLHAIGPIEHFVI